MGDLRTADSMAEDDDIGLVYRAVCGGVHWRCYLCEPPTRSTHYDTIPDAQAAFGAHVSAVHGEELA